MAKTSIQNSLAEKRKLEYALKLLCKGETTLNKAAEIAGIDVWDLSKKIKEAKILWVKDQVVQEDLRAI